MSIAGWRRLSGMRTTTTPTKGWTCSWYQHQCLSHVNKVTFVCQLWLCVGGVKSPFHWAPIWWIEFEGVEWAPSLHLISKSTSWTVRRLVFSGCWWWSSYSVPPVPPLWGGALCCVFIMCNNCHLVNSSTEQEDDEEEEKALMGITIVIVLRVVSEWTIVSSIFSGSGWLVYLRVVPPVYSQFSVYWALKRKSLFLAMF